MEVSPPLSPGKFFKRLITVKIWLSSLLNVSTFNFSLWFFLMLLEIHGQMFLQHGQTLYLCQGHCFFPGCSSYSIIFCPSIFTSFYLTLGKMVADRVHYYSLIVTLSKTVWLSLKMTPVIIYHSTSPCLSIKLDREFFIFSLHLWWGHWVALDWGFILESIYSFCHFLLVITFWYPLVTTLSSID